MGSYLWGNFPGAMIWGQPSKSNYLGVNFPQVIILGGNYLGGNFPRGQLSLLAMIRGAMIQGAMIQGAITWVAFIRGAIFLGGNSPDIL